MNVRNAKSCLVLGGKGFVGAALASEAKRRGYRTLVVDKDEYQAATGTACDLLINANGNSKKFLAAEDPKLEFDLSVRSVLRSLHDFKPKRYIHLSTIDVYYPDVHFPEQNPETKVIDPAALSPYGFHKFQAEQLVRYYAQDWIIFRMGGLVGQSLWKNSIYDLLHGHPLRVHPDSEYQYINTSDLARAVLDLAEKDVHRELFNIAGEGVISLREAAGMIPGLQLDPAWNTLPRERYEISTGKIKRHIALPRTLETVRTFIRPTLSE